jgi:hypothetical protein
MSMGWGQRILRWLAALALLPVDVGMTWALALVVRDSVGALHFWVPLSLGIALWLLVYNTLPRPMWLYVFGHELTHALCAWCFGAKVQGFRVGRGGGEVRVSRSNTIIALGPYFLPIYAILWSLAALGARIWLGRPDWLLPVFHAGLGFTYAFHVTMTAVILRVRQPDLVGEGFLFSAVVIWFGNVLVPLIALPALGAVGEVPEALRLAAWKTIDVFRFLGRAW